MLHTIVVIFLSPASSPYPVALLLLLLLELLLRLLLQLLMLMMHDADRRMRW